MRTRHWTGGALRTAPPPSTTAHWPLGLPDAETCRLAVPTAHRHSHSSRSPLGSRSVCVSRSGRALAQYADARRSDQCVRCPESQSVCLSSPTGRRGNKNLSLLILTLLSLIYCVCVAVGRTFRTLSTIPREPCRLSCARRSRDLPGAGQNRVPARPPALLLLLFVLYCV